MAGERAPCRVEWSDPRDGRQYLLDDHVEEAIGAAGDGQEIALAPLGIEGPLMGIADPDDDGRADAGRFRALRLQAGGGGSHWEQRMAIDQHEGREAACRSGLFRHGDQQPVA